MNMNSHVIHTSLSRRKEVRDFRITHFSLEIHVVRGSRGWRNILQCKSRIQATTRSSSSQTAQPKASAGAIAGAWTPNRSSVRKAKKRDLKTWLTGKVRPVVGETELAIWIPPTRSPHSSGFERLQCWCKDVATPDNGSPVKDLDLSGSRSGLTDTSQPVGAGPVESS